MKTTSLAASLPSCGRRGSKWAGRRWRRPTSSATRPRWSAASRRWTRLPRPTSRHAATRYSAPPAPSRPCATWSHASSGRRTSPPVIDLETSAIRIHEREMRVVPGLLQTEEYARAVISAGKPRDSSAAIDRAVSARLERQANLARENPPMLWHVLHEGVLRHVVGSPAIMRGQLDKLAELARE